MTKICNGDPNKIYKTEEMTPGQAIAFEGESMRPVGVKRIRVKCTECGRRVWSSVSADDQSGHDFILHRIPPHKRKHWWKKGVKA